MLTAILASLSAVAVGVLFLWSTAAFRNWQRRLEMQRQQERRLDRQRRQAERVRRANGALYGAPR